MSYSLSTSCGCCTKRGRCTDRHVLEGAIEAIHRMPSGVGHLGAGQVDLNCKVHDLDLKGLPIGS